VHHYNRLREIMPRPFLRCILLGDVILFSLEDEKSCFAITLGLPRDIDKEGELSLNLEVDGKMVFLISFTIVPGRVVRSDAKDVLLISRIQGMKDCFSQIQHATKRLNDVAPGALLLAALQGVGAALGIGVMGCIMAKHQSACSKENYQELRTAYDDFFTELGVERNAADIYLAEIPHKERPQAAYPPEAQAQARDRGNGGAIVGRSPRRSRWHAKPGTADGSCRRLFRLRAHALGRS
jgi:uncharacterized protein VirK/YbjX